MTKQPQAMRTCTACGQKKPLVAFLELAGNKGHTYGDICATCRGSGLGRKKASEGEPADKSGGTSRLQIDNKAKMQREHEIKEQAKQTTELDYEEKIKKETTEAEKSTETELREETEKKYREDYLEQKKQSTARPSKTEPTTPKEAQMIQSQTFYQEKARTTTEFITQTNEQQLGKKTTGLSPEYVNRYVSSTGRSAESLFGQFLGQFLRNHLQAKATGPLAAQNKANPESKTAQQKTAPAKEQASSEPNKTEEKENLAVDFVKNNLKMR